MHATEVLQLMASGRKVSLAAWYAEPLSRREASFWLETVREALHDGRGRSIYHFGFRLAELILRYWNDQDTGMVYETLLATAESEEDGARLELCYGQLLLARKLRPAWKHLDAGFAAAAHMFEPHEYFVVLKRHEALRQLPLSGVAADGARLEDLLKEAGVIRQLRGRRSGCAIKTYGRQDTLG